VATDKRHLDVCLVEVVDMNRDDIIRLAVEARLVCNWDGGCASAWVEGHDLTPYLERFAALVAAAEREACVYRANIALLGADRGLANRINHAIRNRT
jgi:hypothetical protein